MVRRASLFFFMASLELESPSPLKLLAMKLENL
jgi:hypothetical protein